MTTGPIAACRHLHKSFGPRQVLTDLDLAVAAGESVALVGRSGSGKSTLLRLIAGLLRPDSGEVVAGPATLMFQQPRLLPWFPAWRNVTVGAPKGRAAAVAALDEVGLSSLADAYPASLSGGEGQRVAVARALATAPQILLLDEPFAALDALTRREMHRLLAEVRRRRGLAALIVTHDVAEAAAVADRALVLAGGRIAAEFSAGPDCEQQLLSALGAD